VNWFSDHHLILGATSISYAALLLALSVIVGGFVAASKIGNRIRSLGEGRSARTRWPVVAAQIVGYALRFVSVAAALQITGINIASVFAGGAVLVVGIGIAMQKVAENFVSGIILFAERSIQEGDIIEFDGRVAKVMHMGIRATIAVTLDDEEIIVPNSMLAQSAVKNLTLTEIIYRLRIKIGISYSADVDRAAKVLEEAAKAVAWREASRDPVILLTDFGASSIDFEVSVWTRDVWALRRGQSELRKAAWRALREANISIPFPQLDVHFPDNQPKEVADGH